MIVNANEAQVKALLEKLPTTYKFSFLGFNFKIKVNKLIKRSCIYDDYFHLFHIELELSNNKICKYQLRDNDVPCFVEFYPFNGATYTINYPKEEMHNALKEIGIEAKNDFIKGIQI